ncbi:helix-turn-helix transcriptional regulator [Nocardia sp. BSTN01]|uniref:helix-turn-helix domain-containing protein n=1 Tax=Nocardia sp. BSTN01 TaxID=2783665 RepID=UPI00188E3EF6|nr:helix-turn-helix transcriptional regulator [Nocardia sp. BSTN01]MBF5001821.1 helix-turn-helix transcriptional regulator [Nocardia sp. BSTN01]
MTIDGKEIRAARARRGWSQAQLIAALHAHASQQGIALMSPHSLRIALSRWENGRHAPDRLYARLLRQVLGVPSTTVDLARGDTLFEVLLNHTNSLRMLDRRFGAPAARLQTAAHVTALDAMWHSSKGTDRSVIARAQADAAALAAWQDFDVGDTAAAAAHYKEARIAALRAEDPILLVHTLGEEAVMLAETGQAEAALAQVSQAERIPGLPPLLRSWLSATGAQVATYCPGDTSTAREALAAAEALLPTDSSCDDEMPFIAHNETHLSRWAGHILARLADPAAATLTRHSMQVIPEDFVRARCAQQLDLAQAAINAGQREEAMSLLSATADHIDDLGSGRLRRRHDSLQHRTRKLLAAS